jgi:hypothetical protein
MMSADSSAIINDISMSIAGQGVASGRFCPGFGPLVRALQHFDEGTQKAARAALPSMRQVQPRRPVPGMDTAEEALAVTLDAVGSVDLDYARPTWEVKANRHTLAAARQI